MDNYSFELERLSDTDGRWKPVPGGLVNADRISSGQAAAQMQEHELRNPGAMYRVVKVTREIVA